MMKRILAALCAGSFAGSHRLRSGARRLLPGREGKADRLCHTVPAVRFCT